MFRRTTVSLFNRSTQRIISPRIHISKRLEGTQIGKQNITTNLSNENGQSNKINGEIEKMNTTINRMNGEIENLQKCGVGISVLVCFLFVSKLSSSK